MSIKKIAEMAGVSYSTVSRVLNDPSYKCSSEEVRSRILSAARDLNYVPNEAARNLRLGVEPGRRVLYIGILVTRTESANVDPFFSELTRMTEGEIHRSMCILSNIWYRSAFSSEDEPEESHERFAREMLNSLEHAPDGLVIIGKCVPAAVKILRKRFRYIVSINRNSTNYEIDEVTCDGRKIAQTAVEYLIRLGHRRIAYAGDCHNEARYRGYRETLFKYGLDSDIDYSVDIRQSEEHGYKAMEQLAQRKNPPTAIYCANDIIAIGMLRWLGKNRSRYYSPSVISSDDIEEAQYTKPMLSTVRLPKDDMAKFALYLLLDRINGGHRAVARIELEGTLILRESCSPPDDASEHKRP